MTRNSVRWLARVLSLALATLFAAIAIGGGLPPLRPPSVDTLLFCLFISCYAGLLMAWRWELFGGFLSVAGIIAFYAADFANTGFGRFPGGWVFPLLLLNGLLFVSAGFISRHGARRKRI
jgi:hypothetical protein